MPQNKGFELTPALSIIIAGVIIAAAIIFVRVSPAPTDQAAAAGEKETSVPAPSAQDHVMGSIDAPIVLIEYSDFQCPYCQVIYPSLKRIVAESNGQVAWIMREYPLYQIHPQAIPAAYGAECIAEQQGNEGFWKFADAIFADQSKLSDGYYEALAQTLGADVQSFSECTQSKKYEQLIQDSIAQAQLSGGNGTPYTIIYNTKTGKQFAFSGALPEAQIRALIKAAQ